MKKLLLFFFLLAISVSLKAEPNVFFSEDFESYEEGDFFSQRDDLKCFQEDYKDKYTYDITNVTTKCLSVYKFEGGWGEDSGIWIPMGTQPSVFTDSGVLRIRFQIKSSYNMAGVMLGDGEDGRALYCYRNGGTFYFKSSDYEFGVGGIGDQNFTPVEFNISYPARRLMNVIVNSVTNTPENFVLDEVNVNYFGVGVFGGGAPKCAPIDDVEAAYESLYEPVPKISTDTLEYSPEEGYKKNGNATDWFIGLPPMTNQLLKKIFVACGCHIYNENDDSTLCGAGLIVVHTKDGGQRTITLKNGKQIKLNLEPSHTVVLDAETGAVVLE